MPHKLKLELSVYIYQQTYESLNFLKGKSSSFIAWICPLFKPQVITNYQYIFFEGDDIPNIYFLQKGSAGMVLPKHDNTKFVNITKGNQFGVVDIIGSILMNDDMQTDDWFIRKDKMKR